MCIRDRAPRGDLWRKQSLPHLWILRLRSQEIHAINRWPTSSWNSQEVSLSNIVGNSVLPRSPCDASRSEATKSSNWQERKCQACRLWSCKSFWASCENIYSWGCYALVQSPRNPPRMQRILDSNRYVEHRLYICRNGVKTGIVYRWQWDRLDFQNILGSRNTKCKLLARSVEISRF